MRKTTAFAKTGSVMNLFALFLRNQPSMYFSFGDPNLLISNCILEEIETLRSMIHREIWSLPCRFSIECPCLRGIQRTDRASPSNSLRFVSERFYRRISRKIAISVYSDQVEDSLVQCRLYSRSSFLNISEVSPVVAASVRRGYRLNVPTSHSIST